MRELVSESLECNVCGSRVRVARGTTFVESFGDESHTRVRSGLAHASGFAGVLYLFHNSLAMFLLPLAPESAVLYWLVVACGMLAPLALVLAFAAGVSLDQSREKAGALPALFGLIVGLWGSFDLALVLGPWLRYLKAF